MILTIVSDNSNNYLITIAKNIIDSEGLGDIRVKFYHTNQLS